MKSLKPILIVLNLAWCYPAFSQKILFEFGERKDFNKWIAGDKTSESLRWVDVNTTDTTWCKKGDTLVGKG